MKYFKDLGANYPRFRAINILWLNLNEHLKLQNFSAWSKGLVKGVGIVYNQFKCKLAQRAWMSEIPVSFVFNGLRIFSYKSEPAQLLTGSLWIWQNQKTRQHWKEGSYQALFLQQQVEHWNHMYILGSAHKCLEVTLFYQHRQ